ncbi:hypothetical protein M404DRAFT_35256 [Pisolithus tinctorius Marx 270]|uniref:CxC2-like cysteine cluster KDZ transposase-associated domain-containing protein n=1 Tax=Pisolithus tinctorius Marx 270 TaxID=870435 RepID=A0A0C3J976_PISTI|nr:hypothetical protein M404DRAFT_35256 [Pisolithus tinctorius Marx 270]
MAKRSTGKRMRMIGRTAGHRVKQLEVKTRTTSGWNRSRLVEVAIEQHQAASTVHSPRSSPSKHSRSPSKHHMHTVEDALDMQHDNNAPSVEPLRLLRKMTQNDYIWEWLPHKEEFMKVLLELEAPPNPRNCIKWTQTGAQLHLGHNRSACHSAPSHANGTGGPAQMNAREWEDFDDVPPNMRRPVGSKYLTVVDVTGVHFIAMHWCQCEAAESLQVQLLRAKLFPATFEKPSTAFTFAVLDDFVRDNLECGTSGMNYYSKLRRVSSGVFPHLVPDRYRELLQVAQQWRLLKLLKWNSFLGREKAPKKGDLGLFCATCLQPGINVDPVEDLDHWRYTRTLVMDGNFKAEHMHDRCPEDQVWLMDGCGYMVTDLEYRAYVKGTPHIAEKSACNNHKAINQANAQWGRLHSTGIGATACARHGCFYPHSVVNFQKGERQLNMDYSLANALSYNMAGINCVLCFYDINCSYMTNLRKRVGNSTFIDIPNSMQIMPGIGIWHVHGHKQECYARHAPLFMQGAGWVDGEIIETLWSLLNVASTSARGMSSPHRQELLDFQMSDCNFMKMICMADSLIRKLTTVKVAADMAKRAFKSLDEALSAKQHETWSYQEQVAFRDRMVDASAMDIFEVQMKKAPTVHAVELELLNNIPPSRVHRGMGSWLARGLRLEEAAITLRIDRHNVGANAPELKRLAFAQRKERLLSERSGFIADSAIYIGLQQELGVDLNPINEGENEILDGSSMSDGYLSDADDPNGSSDETLAADTTDLGGITMLPLPSNLGIDAFHSSNLGHLHDMELRLRIGQANDALNGLRLALVDKAVIFRNVVRHSKSYSMKMRAWDAIHTINGAVRKQATIYKQCRKAMVVLGASAETLTRYQQLQTTDLTITTAVINQNAHAHWASNLPWFWSIDVPTDMESITWMSEFYRTHWLRAKAVRDRWSEEEELLTAEFQWTINFFNH